MSTTSVTRPEPAASGTLARTPLVHLLLYAVEKSLGGTIEFATPDRRTAAVLFEGGKPAKARTSEAVAYLGRVLVDLAFFGEEQLARSLAELAEAKRAGPVLHGQMLLRAGVIDERQLQAGLREQMARKLRHVGSFPGDTAYAYYSGFDSLGGWGDGGAKGIDPTGMLWRVLRENPPRSAVEAALARIASSPLRLMAQADIARLELGKEQAAAAELLRARPMRAAELASMCGLGEDETQLVVYLLLVTKQVEVLRAHGAPQAESSAPRTAPVASADSSAPRMAPVASADSSAPRRAPVATTTPSPSPTTTSPPPAGARMTPRPSSPGPTMAPPPPAPPNLPPPLVERWNEIVERAATIDRADYFSMLDLARDATKDDIENSFIELAKQWHPDRLPAELAPVRDACSRVFARMSEARSTLADDEQRARYMRLLADGSGSPEMQETVAKVIEAATNFQKAEVCFKRNDYAQAEAFCRKAVDADATQPDYLALLAWLVALKPENQSPDKTREPLQMLDRAVALSSRCEKAYFYRGMLNKRVGKSDAAMRDFRRAVDLNPRNIDAAREVRLHRMRGGRHSDPPGNAGRQTSDSPKAAEDPKPGLFGRLFKKS